jgi:hypothetical protein
MTAQQIATLENSPVFWWVVVATCLLFFFLSIVRDRKNEQ